MENATYFVQNQPGDLVILEGHTHDGAKENLDHIPLHMRAVLLWGKPLLEGETRAEDCLIAAAAGKEGDKE